MVGAEPFEIDLTRAIDRDFDYFAVLKERLQRCKRSIEKIVPIVPDELSRDHVHA
jgi:hypothetical protein